MKKKYCYLVKFWIDDENGNEKSNGMCVDGVYSTLEKAQGYLDFLKWAYTDNADDNNKADAYFVGDTKIEGIHFRVPSLVVKEKNGDITYYTIERMELK